jgi:hypothetical protein
MLPVLRGTCHGARAKFIKRVIKARMPLSIATTFALDETTTRILSAEVTVSARVCQVPAGGQADAGTFVKRPA